MLDSYSHALKLSTWIVISIKC